MTIPFVIQPVNIAYATSDAVAVHALYWVPKDVTHELGCVVAHGFTGSSARPEVQRICRSLADTGIGVLSPDFRGHGRSGGATTAGDLETLDVAAAVRWLRAQGYHKVAIVGFSMGGSAVLRYAGSDGCDADAVVSVSSPGMWFERGTRPMRRVHFVLERAAGRALLRFTKGVRVAGSKWEVVPRAPHEVAGAIDVPLLLVHGEDDHYFPRRHIDALAAAAPGATVWIEPGMAHAESATTEALTARIAEWLWAVLRDGVWDDVPRGD
ncbi:MAG TPA: alpha/beta fold hydrolase [Jatrophihabitans sp.]